MTPLAFAGMLGISSAAELNPAAVIYKLPDQIPWGPVNAARAQSAVVVGDPTKPGFYMATTNGPRAIISAARTSIPTIATSSCCRVRGGSARGRNSIPPTRHRCRPAVFVTHFAKEVHWDGAKDEDAVLLIMGEGPATSTAAEEK